MGIDWYNGRSGYSYPGTPCLAIGYDSGELQIMKHELDDGKTVLFYFTLCYTLEPVILSSVMQVRSIKWNTSGTLLAVGCIQQQLTDKDFSYIHFYSPTGQVLY